MAENWVKKPVEWTIKDIGAPLLDSLAGGLYSKLDVFREYVQNAVDSYTDFEQMTGRTPQNTVQVWVDTDNAALHIKDDGIGMDWEDIQTAKAIAVSPKLLRFNEFVGFRGLGIWSGLSACERLILTTTKIGIPYAYRLVIDCKGIVEHYQDPIPIDELLTDRLEIDERQCDKEDHFTQVKLVNIHTDRFHELLDVEELTRYAEQKLPVPFDPDWKSMEISGDSTSNKSYTEVINDMLQDIPWTANYVLTINGVQVYRHFQPVSEIKPPERHVIKDDFGKEVAVAWLCETNRRSPKIALKVSPEKSWVRNFAIRVKNFTIGERGHYANQGVMDPGNLDWFVGEIYITDNSIKPDTKRSDFQTGPRHDAVIKALRDFYTSTALRARGWSAQINVEEDSDRVQYITAEIKEIFENNELSYLEKVKLLDQPVKELSKLRKSLKDARDDANKIDTLGEAERTTIQKRYLRKKEVKQAIDLALGLIASTEKLLEQLIPDTSTSEPDAKVSLPSPPTLSPDVSKPATSNKDGRSKARTNRLKGNHVSANDALSTHAVAGVLPGLELFIEKVEGKEELNENKRQFSELDTALEAFRSAVAAVVGEQSEIFHKIMDQLNEELRRRGINV
jgi:hypothetical protein